jgi:hypothetical protein
MVSKPKIAKIPLDEVFFWRHAEGQKD